MKRYLVGEKFEWIVIDIIRLFLKLENGNFYIFVVVDYFIKFMEIFLLLNLEVEIVVDVIFKGWIRMDGFGEIYID